MPEFLETRVDKFTFKVAIDRFYNGEGVEMTASRCRFIQDGAMTISWDGNLSPCLPRIYTHTSYQNAHVRLSNKYVVGNLVPQDLLTLWNSPEYVSFRQRVAEFDFSPCTHYGVCKMAEANEEDFFGNTFPTCGGCLWVRGVIQCP